MPSLLERPKMTKMMYQALKRHIMNERERKKQAEQEQDAILERQRKEREMRKKKEEENSLTLEQSKEQIVKLENRLVNLKAEKHELFSQLKKVLHQEDESRKRAQLKEQSELLSLQQTTAYTAMPPVSGHPVLLPPGTMSGRPSMYRPAQTIMAPAIQNVPVKRPRSPSPPPTSAYQYEAKINPAAVKQQQQQQQQQLHQSGIPFPHPQPTQQDFKPGAFHPQSQPVQVTYPISNQGPVAFQQASASYTVSKSPASKYNMAPSQSAFSSYPSHYAAHQQQKQIAEQPPYPGFPIQRLQQPGSHGYLSANIPLQQQLEQANQKAGFNEKIQQQQSQIRGVAPISVQNPVLIQHQLQQSAPGKGSIVTGYSGRQPAPPGPQTSSYQPTSSAPGNYPGAQQQAPPGRPGYQASRGFY